MTLEGPQQGQRSTLADVAALAKVSTKTASLALTEGAGAAQTVKRVRDAAEALGYVSRKPRPVGPPRTRTIFVSAAIQLNPLYYADIVARLKRRLLDLDRGTTLLYEYGDGTQQSDVAAFERAIAQRIAGAILFSPRAEIPDLHRFMQARIPTVIVGMQTDAEIREQLKDISVFDFSYKQAYTELFQDLVEARGHREIVYLSGRSRSFSSQQREERFRAEFARREMVVEDYHVHPFNNDSENPTFWHGEYALNSLMSRTVTPKPTAIIAYNDSMAMGCIGAAQARGIRVPEDLSIVGHDDLPFGEYINPKLSTISIHREKLAGTVAEELHRLMEGQAPRHDRIPAVYRPKGSVGACPRPPAEAGEAGGQVVAASPR